ncbi:MAG TPA: alanine--tRNA ligase [Alphaproteobacteria bacterium]|nr:alanine--tRNA ligase [Alphaproteobacteria bacterium]
MKTLADIRSSFLTYFKDNGHEVVKSSSLVPQNDPTLLFTNAGMVQFKDLFTGQEKRSYTKATTSQKCLRAGGKHNDLENVGYTARHHTFFEMLGNFSFGDYFKEQAIHHAWTFLTKSLGLPKEKLLVTVYHEDEEAALLWKKIAGLNDDKIIRIKTSDNFWSMGDTGTCGPCTEVFYDHGEGIFGGPPGSKDEDGDRFIEIWNVVFMQYEQFKDGRRANLPKPSVDTGMGLERIAAVLQGVHSNFEIDLFQHLIKATKSLLPMTSQTDVRSYNVIADHLRASSFLIAEGVLPSNEGRGYVLRHIMRRAMRHTHLLGAKEPLMHRLVPSLIEAMGDAYPELKTASALLTTTLKQEEERFTQTLDRGLKLLTEESSKLSKGSLLSGDVAFKLYDTYGFPVDLTADILRSQENSVDMEEFDRCMNAQKQTARESWSGSGDQKKATHWIELSNTFSSCKFQGFETLEARGALKALFVNGKAVTSINAQDISETDLIEAVFDQTPFYGESGGQAGDSGQILLNHKIIATVQKTSKPFGELISHVLKLEEEIKVDETYTLQVDQKKRQGLKQHHSATHLLHKALRQVLGDHVVQKGSLVEENRLRFDFTHNAPLTKEQLQNVEELVNTAIQQNLSVQTAIKTPEEAAKDGAMALFGEKYGDKVRVVSMGDFSMELCGGTHVTTTGEIGLLKVLTETGVSSGIRRVEAVCGFEALSYLTQIQQILQECAGTFKVSILDVSSKVKALLDDKKSLEKQIADLKKQVALGGGETHSGDVDLLTLAGYPVLSKNLVGVLAKDLKGLADEFKPKIKDGIVLLTSQEEGGKVSVVCALTGALSKTLNAVDIVKVASHHLKGKGGGGRPDMAQAGGEDASKIDTLLEALETYLKHI